MMEKKRFSAHLQYNWWMYVAAAIAVVLLWSFVFTRMVSPSETEKVTVEFFGDDLDIRLLNQELAADRAVISQQKLKEITCVANPDFGAMLVQTVVSRAILSDILILPEHLITGENAAIVPLQYFPEIPLEEFEAICAQRQGGAPEGLAYFYYDGKPYGIYLNEPGTRFSNYCDTNERYVAFFSTYSVNTGGLFGKGRAEDTAAVDVIAYLAEVAK